MTDLSKNGEQTEKAKPPGLFKPGGPGGPGRPQGSRNKASLALDNLADGEAAAILEKQIEKAKEGDATAAHLILSRVWPARKSRAINLYLPPLEQASDIVAALGVVANAVGTGAITPDEAQAVAAILETKRKAIETVELEKRVTALEQERK
jgi:hypothetical protein